MRKFIVLLIKTQTNEGLHEKKETPFLLLSFVEKIITLHSPASRLIAASAESLKCY